MITDDVCAAGLAAEEAGDFIGAGAAFASLLGSDDPLVVATAQFHMGRVAWKQGRLDEALGLCETARASAIRLGDVDLRARVENAIGVLHVARGEYGQAQAAYTVALELTADTVTRAKIRLNLGVIANIQGRFDDARRHYGESLELFEASDDDRGVALALHNIGMWHADRREWDEADEAFRRALALFEERGNKQMIANVLTNRSEVCYGRGEVDEAIARCDLALSVYAEIGDEVGRGDALRWKGHGLRLRRRFQEANVVLTEALRIAERTRGRLLEAEVLRELGWVHRGVGDATRWGDVLRRALRIFRELGAEADVAAIEKDLRA